MSSNNFLIERMTVYKITAGVLSVGQIWYLKNGAQDIAGAVITAETETIIGPFTENALIRLETHSGNLTFERVALGAQVPTLLLGDVATISLVDTRLSEAQRLAIDELPDEDATTDEIVAALKAVAE